MRKMFWMAAEKKKPAARPKKEKNLFVTKPIPFTKCTHTHIKKLYKHKERKTAALTSRLCALG